MRIRLSIARRRQPKRSVVQRESDSLVDLGLDAVDAVQIAGAAAAEEEHIAGTGHFAGERLLEHSVARGGRMFPRRLPLAAEARVHELVFDLERGRVQGSPVFGVVLHHQRLAAGQVAFWGSARAGDSSGVTQGAVVAELGRLVAFLLQKGGSVPYPQPRRAHA